jgi:hypothetical protein
LALLDETPPEPNEIKRAIEALMDGMTNETWDWQSLAVWYGNKLPQYLWTEQNWKSELSKIGWRWQSFLSLLSKHTLSIIHWVTNEISWSDLLAAIIADLRRSQLVTRSQLEEFL